MAVSAHGLRLELNELPVERPTEHSSADLAIDTTGIGTVWPAAHLLCEYMRKHAHLLCGKRVMEFGAGAGLPGLLAARLGAAHVLITDAHPLVCDQLRHNARLNGLASRVSVAELTWPSAAQDAGATPLLIGADLVASERAARALACTVAAQLDRGGGVFLYAHAERRAIYRAADGSVVTEPTDGALDALREALTSRAPNIMGAPYAFRQLGAVTADAVAAGLESATAASDDDRCAAVTMREPRHADAPPAPPEHCPGPEAGPPEASERLRLLLFACGPADATEAVPLLRY